MALTLLIVDDVALVRKLLAKQLVAIGYTNLLEAADGESALALLESRSVDLLLTDSTMPGMDGLQLLGRIRSNPKLARLPVIVVTAHEQAGDEQASIAAGAFACLRKPVKPEDLKAKVAGAVARTGS